MSASPITWLQDLLVRAKSSEFISSRKRLIPSSLRNLGWNIVRSRQIFSIAGSKMFIPPGDRNQSLALDQYEPEVTGKLREITKPGMTFCDVGGNIGIITLLASRLVGPTGKVISFEPIPDNAEVLRDNIARNGYTNVTLVEKAISSKPGKAEIYLSDLCGCHSLVSNPSGATGRKLVIETVRLDGFPELQKIDVLKIDTEGFELEVLRSLGNVKPRHVILEYNYERCNAAGISWSNFYQSLKDFGFTGIECVDEPSLDLNSLDGKPISINLYMRSVGV